MSLIFFSHKIFHTLTESEREKIKLALSLADRVGEVQIFNFAMSAIKSLEYVFIVHQHRSETAGFDLVSSSGLVSNKKELSGRLEYCGNESHNTSKCAQEVLDDLTVIYESYANHMGTQSTHMVRVDGDLKVLQYKDEMQDGADRYISIVVPVSSQIYLASDSEKATVTSYIAPHYPDFKNLEKLGYSLRERTVKLDVGNDRINGITTNDESLMVTMTNKAEIKLYPLFDIVFGNGDQPVRPSKRMGYVIPEGKGHILNEIEYIYGPAILGVQKNSDRILVFNKSGGAAYDEINFVDAVNRYFMTLPKPHADLDHFELLPKDTVVNGLTNIAYRWCIVSIGNSSRRFIIKF